MRRRALLAGVPAFAAVTLSPQTADAADGPLLAEDRIPTPARFLTPEDRYRRAEAMMIAAMNELAHGANDGWCLVLSISGDGRKGRQRFARYVVGEEVRPGMTIPVERLRDI